MNLLNLYFTIRGRLSRSQYWLGMLGVAIAAAIMFAIVWLSSYPLLALPFILFVFVSVYTLAIKRLHDRGKSGWWTLVFLLVPGTLDRMSDKLTEGTVLWWVLVIAGSVLSLWGLIEVGFRRGTAGDNHYGPDPLAKTGTDAIPGAVNP